MWGWLARCACREIPEDEVLARLGAALACVRGIERRLASEGMASVTDAARALGRLRAVVGSVSGADVDETRAAIYGLTATFEEMRRSLTLARRAKTLALEEEASDRDTAGSPLRRAPRPPS